MRLSVQGQLEHMPALTDGDEELLDVDCCLSRSLEVQNTVFLSVTVCLLVIDLTTGVQICFVTSQRNHHVGVPSPLKLLDPRLGASEGVLCRRGAFYESEKVERLLGRLRPPTLLVTS